MRKLMVVGGLLAIMPCVLWAKGNRAVWENLTILRAGQKVEVIDKSLTRHSGRFSSVDDRTIIIHDQSGDHTIARPDVLRVNARGHRLQHALIGLGIGAGGGAAVGAASGGCSSGSCIGLTRNQVAGIGAALGGAIGAIIGAVLPAHNTVYRAPAQ
ncbi:MAG: hypothetical protein WBD87_09585 [Candidatus Acidiferrales bacterium]